MGEISKWYGKVKEDEDLLVAVVAGGHLGGQYIKNQPSDGEAPLSQEYEGPDIRVEPRVSMPRKAEDYTNFLRTSSTSGKGGHSGEGGDEL